MFINRPQILIQIFGLYIQMLLPHITATVRGQMSTARSCVEFLHLMSLLALELRKFQRQLQHIHIKSTDSRL